MTALIVAGWLATNPVAVTENTAQASRPGPVTMKMAPPSIPTSQQLPANRLRRSKAQQIASITFGAIGGAFLAGHVGASIEGDSCKCDVPGLRGFVIAAPIGAVIGGILGAKR